MFIATQEFLNFELLELMPNLRSLYLTHVPRILEKYYAKLERVELQVGNDEEVHSFRTFLRMNRQIKYLKLVVGLAYTREHDLLYSSIAENFKNIHME